MAVLSFVQYRVFYYMLTRHLPGSVSVSLSYFSFSPSQQVKKILLLNPSRTIRSIGSFLLSPSNEWHATLLFFSIITTISTTVSFFFHSWSSPVFINFNYAYSSTTQLDTFRNAFNSRLLHCSALFTMYWPIALPPLCTVLLDLIKSFVDVMLSIAFSPLSSTTSDYIRFLFWRPFPSSSFS